MSADNIPEELSSDTALIPVQVQLSVPQSLQKTEGIVYVGGVVCDMIAAISAHSLYKEIKCHNLKI